MLTEHNEGVQLILLPPEDLAAEFKITVPSNVVSLNAAAHQKRSWSAAWLLRTYSLIWSNGSRPCAILPRAIFTGATTSPGSNGSTALAKANGLSLLATNDVHYHSPERRPLQDVMTAIRHKTTVAMAGHLLHVNAERYLKSPTEMVKLFARWPHAIAAARAVADACSFTLDELKYLYPETAYPEGRTPQQQLEVLTWEGAEGRYPQGIPAKVRKSLVKELD